LRPIPPGGKRISEFSYLSLDLSPFQPQELPSVRVYVKTREAAARKIDPAAMVFLKDIGGGEGFDDEFVDFPKGRSES
jgi:hypothetical protein